MKRLKRIIEPVIFIAILLIGIFSSQGEILAESQWSDWEDGQSQVDGKYEQEIRTVYRYQDKETTTSENSTLSGWTQYDSSTTWGDWSAWQDSEVSSGSTRQVNTRKLYRYRNKSTTTSSNSTLSGWTKYDSKTTWGNWSAWQDSAVTSSSTRKVETRQVQVSAAYTQYRYGRWRSDNCSKGSWWHFCNACGQNLYGGTWYIQYTPWLNSPIAGTYDGSHCNHSYNQSNDSWQRIFKYNNSNYYWQQSQDIPATYKTQYRYQDSTTTYYFYKWSEWSDWDTTQPSSTSTREIQNKTQYQYRDSATTYYFYKMSEWSEWSIEQPISVLGRNIESKIQYRYRLKENSDYTYKVLEDGTIEITGYTGSDTVLEIPRIIDGMQVTRIASDAFANHTGLTSVVLPEGVTSIGENAFANCDNLNRIAVPATVTDIAGNAFSKKEGDSKYLIILTPENSFAKQYAKEKGFISAEKVEDIVQSTTGKEIIVISETKVIYVPIEPISLGDKIDVLGVMYRVSSLDQCTLSCIGIVDSNTTEITLPSEVQIKNGTKDVTYKVAEITKNAFKNNKKLATVKIGANITSIGEQAFSGCNGIRKVTISTKKLKTVEKKAFKGIAQNVFTYPSGTKAAYEKMIVGSMKGTCTIISKGIYQINNEKKKTAVFLRAVDDKASTIKVASKITIGRKKYKVTKIGDNAFKNNKKVKKITIGNNITIIGKNAFTGCKRLKEVKIESRKIKKVGKSKLAGKFTIKLPFDKNKEKAKTERYKNMLKKQWKSV